MNASFKTASWAISVAAILVGVTWLTMPVKVWTNAKRPGSPDRCDNPKTWTELTAGRFDSGLVRYLPDVAEDQYYYPLGEDRPANDIPRSHIAEPYCRMWSWELTRTMEGVVFCESAVQYDFAFPSYLEKDGDRIFVSGYDVVVDGTLYSSDVNMNGGFPHDCGFWWAFALEPYDWVTVDGY